MRAQLAEALTQIAQEYTGKPFMVVGDYNAAASPEDRGTGKLLPYDTAPDALTVVLMRLSLTDIYRQKIPPLQRLHVVQLHGPEDTNRRGVR